MSESGRRGIHCILFCLFLHESKKFDKNSRKNALTNLKIFTWTRVKIRGIFSLKNTFYIDQFQRRMGDNFLNEYFSLLFYPQFHSNKWWFARKTLPLPKIETISSIWTKVKRREIDLNYQHYKLMVFHFVSFANTQNAYKITTIKKTTKTLKLKTEIFSPIFYTRLHWW